MSLEIMKPQEIYAPQFEDPLPKDIRRVELRIIEYVCTFDFIK